MTSKRHFDEEWLCLFEERHVVKRGKREEGVLQPEKQLTMKVAPLAVKKPRPPLCLHCDERGHYVTECPLAQEERNLCSLVERAKTENDVRWRTILTIDGTRPASHGMDARVWIDLGEGVSVQPLLSSTLSST